MRGRLVVTWLVLLFLVMARPAHADTDAKASPTAARYGAETLAKIQSAFLMPGRALYAVEIDNGKPARPSWVWDASIQLGALCAAARVEPEEKYLPQVKAYATALRSYRTTTHDRPGFDVNPPPKNPDRYYDDNAWICLSLLEAHALTQDPDDLKAATEAYDFMMSGADDQLDGGIYWHEDRPTSKNACSSGPAMLASLAFYERTKEQRYLDTAKRLYDWTRQRLQDPADGLVFDSIRVADGRVNRAKYTYNSATLVRAACTLYRVTGGQAYLDEAHRVARAAEERFVRKDDGAITGAGKLGVKLVEAFLELYDTDHDDHWRQVVGRSLTALHARRNDAGWYPQNWQADPPPPDRPVRLIDQSAPARAFWVAAEHGVEVK